MATRKKAPSKKKTKNKSGSAKVTNLYPEGTPVDPASGEALEDVKISAKKGRRIPLDKESARVSKQHKDVMRRKSSGEPNVRWNSDYRIRFGQAKSFHPHAKVAFRQISPVEDENIAARDMSVFRDYDEVIRYVREAHWKGEQATYKWVVYDDANPQWATGQIHFAADQSVAEAKSNGKKEPMSSQQPPWGGGGGGYPPGGGGGYPPPPGYGYPPQPAPAAPYPAPGYGGYTAPTAYQVPMDMGAPQQMMQPPPPQPQPTPPQSPPQPPPPQPPPPSQHLEPEPAPSSSSAQQQPSSQQQQPNLSDTVVSGLMQQLQYLMHENASLKTQSQHPPQQQPQQQQPQTQQSMPPGYYEWLYQQQMQGQLPGGATGMPGAHGMHGMGMAGMQGVPGGMQGALGIQGMPQQQQPQQQPQQPQQEKQPTVTEQVRDTMGLILELNNLGKAFTQKLNSDEPEQTQPNPTEPNPDEPPFPVQVKEVGPMRMAAVDGQLMRDFWSVGFFNADKIADAFGKMFDKGQKLIKDREESQDRNAAMREKQIADLERLAAAKERWNKAVAGELGSGTTVTTSAEPVPSQPAPAQPASTSEPAPKPSTMQPMQPMQPKPMPMPMPAQTSAPAPKPAPAPPSASTHQSSAAPMQMPAPTAPKPWGVPIGGAAGPSPEPLIEKKPKPEPAPFATMQPSNAPPPAPTTPNPMEPSPASIVSNEEEEDTTEAHPAVAFAIETEKKAAGEFVMPMNPQPINTAMPDYDKDEDEVHPAVATAEAQAQGEPPPLTNGVAPTTEDDSQEEGNSEGNSASMLSP